jgi:hypothetical protein
VFSHVQEAESPPFRDAPGGSFGTSNVTPQVLTTVSPSPSVPRTAPTGLATATGSTATTAVIVISTGNPGLAGSGHGSGPGGGSDLALALAAGARDAQDGRPLFDGNMGSVLAAPGRGSAHDGSLPGEVRPRDRGEVPGNPEGGAGRGPGGLETSDAADPLELEVPSPQRSSLLTNFGAFDRASLERAIDQFLRQFDVLGSDSGPHQGPSDVLVELLAVAVALTAWKMIPRMLGSSRKDEAGLEGVDVASSLDGLSGLPGSWSFDES